MAKRRKILADILKLLQGKPLSYSEILKTIKKPDKVIWQNLNIAKSESLVKQDKEKRYFITPLGISRLENEEVEKPIDTDWFEVYSQIIDQLELRSDRPTAKCTIVIENAKKIRELDAKTDAVKRFLTHDGLWLPENNTNLKAAVGSGRLNTRSQSKTDASAYYFGRTV